MVVVLDGLDEATSRGPQPFGRPSSPPSFSKDPSLAPTGHHQPPPNPKYCSHSRGLRPFETSMLPCPRTGRDLGKPSAARAARHCRRGRTSPPASVERILDRSEGLFLYVHWVLQELALGPPRPSTEPEPVPPGTRRGSTPSTSSASSPRDLITRQLSAPPLKVMAAAQETPWVQPARCRRSAGDEYQAGATSAGSSVPSSTSTEDVPRPFHGSVLEWLTSP